MKQQKHLQKHAELARSLGMDPSHILIGDIGKVIEITADTICIHGDGEKALRFARDIREAFEKAGIDIRPL